MVWFQSETRRKKAYLPPLGSVFKNFQMLHSTFLDGLTQRHQVLMRPDYEEASPVFLSVVICACNFAPVISLISDVTCIRGHKKTFSMVLCLSADVPFLLPGTSCYQKFNLNMAPPFK